MEAYVINLSSSSLNVSSHANAIRIAYLLNNSVVTVGDMIAYIYIDDCLKDADMKHKIEILEKEYRKNNYTEYLNMVLFYKKSSKEMRVIKHPPANLFIAFKRVEDMINKFYKHNVTCWADLSRESGMYELKELIEENEFGFIEATNKNDSTETYTELDILVLFHCKKEERTKEGEFFFHIVTEEFLQFCTINGKIVYTHTDKEALNIKNIYVTKCLRFPLPTILKPVELKAIRIKLLPFCSKYLSMMDFWLKQEEDSLEAISLENANRVIENFLTLQEQIKRNELLSHIDDLQKDEEKEIEVYVGEVPYKNLLDYYHHFNVLTEATYQKIMALFEDDDFLYQRMPIQIIATVPKDETNIIKSIETEEESEKLISRKSISID